MSNLYELNKLESYLKDNGYVYERIDREDGTWVNRHQVIVYAGRNENGEYADRQWDAICHYGSYGYKDGLLEIYGSIVDQRVDGDVVVGNLTAADVIKRLEKKDE